MKKPLTTSAAALAFCSLLALPTVQAQEADDPVTQPETTDISAAAAAEKASLDTLEKEVSYIIGHNAITGLQMQGVDVDVSAYLLGAVRASEDQALIFTQEETTDIIGRFQTKMTAKAEAEAQKLMEENAQRSAAYLQANAEKEGVVTTDSGLQYKVLEAGDGAKPTPANKVKVHYEGRFIDGDIFDSSITRGEPTEFGVTQVIAGWTEALQLMPVGSKYELYIPSDLAYGPVGKGNIAPNEALIFTVELIGIVE